MATYEDRYVVKADFSEVARESAKARREVRRTRDEERSANRESVQGTRDRVRASQTVVQALRRESSAAKEYVTSLRSRVSAESRSLRSTGGLTTARRTAVSWLEKLTHAERDNNSVLSAAVGILATVAGATQKLAQGLSSAASSAGGAGASGFKKLASGVGGVADKVLSLVPAMAKLAVYLAIGSVINPLIASLGSLGAAAIGLASSLGSLGGVLASLPGLFASAATGVGALLTAFGGVGAAFKAFAAQNQAVQTASSDTAATETKNANAVIDAQIALADARLNGARAVQDANERISDSERQLARNQHGVIDAQRGLIDARKAAIKNLRDLRTAVKQAADTEFQSEADVVSAKERYAQLLGDPTATSGDRLQALAAVRNAENALKATKQQNAQNREELRKANREGIEGNDAVIHARFALQDANEAVRDSQREVNRAVQDYPRAQRDATRAVVNAQQALKDAVKQQKDGVSSVAKATDLYQQALDQLSPSARKVVVFIAGLRGEWKKLQGTVQESFFSHIVGDLDRMRGFLPTLTNLLEKSADALGSVADKGIKMITSGPWKRDFATLADRNHRLIKIFGDAAFYAADGFRHLVIAAGPFTEKIAKAIRRGTRDFRDFMAEGRKTGKLSDDLETTSRRLSQWFKIFTNVFFTLYNFLAAASGFADDQTKSLVKMTAGWRKYSEEQRNAGGEGDRFLTQQDKINKAIGNRPRSGFQQWLENVKPLLSAMGKFIGALVKGLADIMSDPKNMERALKLFDQLTNDVLPALLNLLDKMAKTDFASKLLDVVVKLANAFADFLDAGGADAMVGTLKAIGDTGTAIAFVATQIAKINEFLSQPLPKDKGILGSFLSMIAYATTLYAIMRKIPFLNRLPGLRKRPPRARPNETPRGGGDGPDRPGGPRPRTRGTGRPERPSRTPSGRRVADGRRGRPAEAPTESSRRFAERLRQAAAERRAGERGFTGISPDGRAVARGTSGFVRGTARTVGRSVGSSIVSDAGLSGLVDLFHEAGRAHDPKFKQMDALRALRLPQDRNKNEAQLYGIAPTVPGVSRRQDTKLYDIAKQHPEKAFKLIEEAAKRARVPTKTLLDLLPFTAQRLRDVAHGAKSGSAGLADLVTTTGKQRHAQEELNYVYGKTPKNVKTHVTALGVQDALGNITALKDIYDGLDKRVVTTIVKARQAKADRQSARGGRAGFGLVGQRGGQVPGTGTGDKVPALLEPGEFVLQRRRVKELGLTNVRALNGGDDWLQKMQQGGPVRRPGSSKLPSVGVRASSYGTTVVDNRSITNNIYNPRPERASASQDKVLTGRAFSRGWNG